MNRASNRFFICILLFHSFLYSEDLFKAELHLKKGEKTLAVPYELLVLSTSSEKPNIISPLASDRFDLNYEGVSKIKQADKQGWAFRYQFIPKASGNIVIPPFHLSTKTQKVNTLSKTVFVTQPMLSKNMKLECSLDRAEAKPGQGILLKFKLTTTQELNSIKAMQIIIPALQNKSFKVFDPYPKLDQQKTIGLPVGSLRIVANYRETIINHKKTSIISFEKFIQAQEAGHYDFKEAKLICSIKKAQKNRNQRNRYSSAPSYPSYFDNNFFENDNNPHEYTRVYVHSKKQNLLITDYSNDNKPNPFFKLVGKAELSIKAEPKKVSVGEPIQLTISMLHPDNAVFDFPKLNTFQAITRNFKVPNERSPAQVKGKQKIIQQTIWPIRSDVEMIPPLVLHYFDEENQVFRSTESNSIPIEVSESKSIGALEGQFSEDLNLKSKVVVKQGGMAHNIWDGSTQAVTPDHENSVSLFALSLLIPPALFLLFFFRQRHQDHLRKNEKHYQSLYAFKSLNQKSQQGSDYTNTQLKLDIEQYFRDKFQLSSGHIGFTEIKPCLENAPPETLKYLEQWFVEQEHLNYSDQSQQSVNTVKEVLAHIATIERKC